MFRNRRRHAAFHVLLVCMALLCGTALALYDGIVWPEASGEAVDTSAQLTVDHSHADKGYVMVRGEASDKRLKLQIVKDGYGDQFDIDASGKWEVIPLKYGAGNYTIGLFAHVSGNNYSPIGQLSISAQIENPNMVYMIPNQYVYYEEDTPAVAKSDELCEGLNSDQEKYEAIREYIKENYSYDFPRAEKLSTATGVLPSVDYAWENHMGICQDLAALAACMLRVQGIPTQLMIGYVGGNYYHAWTYVTLSGQQILYDPTADVSNIPLDKGYTIQRYY